MVQAVKNACRYIEAGIRTASDMGKGHGPINHFHSTYTLPFAPYVLPQFSPAVAMSLTGTEATSSTICWNDQMSKKPGEDIRNMPS